MADPHDAGSEREFLEKAAAETREPESAREARASQDDAGDASALGDASDSLARSRDRLRDTGEALAARQAELERTGETARDVAARAEELRDDTALTLESVRAIATPGTADGDRR